MPNPFDNSPLLRNPSPCSLNSPPTYLESLLCVVVRFPSTLLPGWLCTDPPPLSSSPFPFPLSQWFPISNACSPTTTFWHRLHIVWYIYILHHVLKEPFYFKETIAWLNGWFTGAWLDTAHLPKGLTKLFLLPFSLDQIGNSVTEALNETGYDVLGDHANKASYILLRYGGKAQDLNIII